MTMGGVGRNIAENLVHLGTPTKLLTAIGDDLYGRKMLEHSGRIGLDMKDCLVLNEQPTSTYLAILDENGDMVAAVNQMDIIDSLGIDYIQSKKTILENARVTVIDTNVREDVIRYVLDNVKNTDFFLDTVSTRKAMKIKDRIGAFHTIMPNRIEAELFVRRDDPDRGRHAPRRGDFSRKGRPPPFSLPSAQRASTIMTERQAATSRMPERSGRDRRGRRFCRRSRLRTYARLRRGQKRPLRNGDSDSYARKQRYDKPQPVGRQRTAENEGDRIMLEKYLDINPEVRAAISGGQAVVALESTIISHGMPYPKNVETALTVERIIRENGAIPRPSPS
jgi:hypothetical protein